MPKADTSRPARHVNSRLPRQRPPQNSPLQNSPPQNSYEWAGYEWAGYEWAGYDVAGKQAGLLGLSGLTQTSLVYTCPPYL
ncbi:MAG: hypothetical protein KKH32_10745 [Bacteroidetes bacterium]|nr:hypothetical protein [Bacteroidota bacterium]